MRYTSQGITLEVAEPYIFEEAIEGLSIIHGKDGWVPETVIDIGANAGSLAIYAAKLGARNVLAVEPVLFPRLVENIYNNGVQDRVVPLPYAVRNKHGPTEMRRITTDGQVGHCFRPERAPIHCGWVPSINPIQLPMLFIHPPRRIDYLKIDIEGGEWELLRTNALAKLLENTHVLDLELHGEGEFMQEGFTGEFDEQAYLAKFGFNIPKDPNMKHVVVEKEYGEQDGNRTQRRAAPGADSANGGR